MDESEADSEESNRTSPSKRTILLFVIATFVVMLGFIVAYAIGDLHDYTAIKLITACGIVATGAFLVGALFGFLSAIPVHKPADSSTAEFQPNNTLQQVMDWLLKILLGAGLTQLGQLPQIGGYLDRFTEIGPVGSFMLGTAMLICGFIAAYFYMSLHVAPSFVDVSSSYARLKQTVTEAVSQSLPEAMSSALVEAELYKRLNEGDENSIDQAIELGERYMRQEPHGSANVAGYLASAYGQKYGHAKIANQPAEKLASLREKALKYGKRAVKLASAKWSENLVYFYDTNEGDNDWSHFKGKDNDPDGRIKVFIDRARKSTGSTSG